MAKIALTGKTDVGLKRSNNEDSLIISPELKFSLVADGMGGAAAGELASRIFADSAMDIFSAASGRTQAETPALIQKAFRLANKKILEHVKKEPSHSGMGCTAELIAFSDEGFALGHVGDSRTYRIRNGLLKQLTHDHSLVQNLVDQGMISAEDARHHPHRNVILRAVGIEENLALDVIKGKTLPGDIFMLCSDGLTDMVEDALIKEVISSTLSIEQKAEGFVELAKLAGGNDNITVVLCQVL
ncbi:MAG: serine/threonine protein phosphatase [Desulfobacteraceae bacterium IS3]|nr:MAG: serine/threonine protein phosphatase [Desulfobacteraceae bacterium IS3]HAO22290.1 Stp1/IreP family PP2C-type Ser/Thr phosphatase [Desulfobacteraceae bacterium]